MEPKDLRGKKIRVQLAKVFSDTINGLGGNAVPMAWGEVVSAAKQGVIDGGDLPVANIDALKIYEVAKYTSLTYHNYGPTCVVMNLEVWSALSDAQKKLFMDVGREAQSKVRNLIESVDNFESAKKLLEPKGMTVVQGNVEAFRKIAEQKVWPDLQVPIRRAVRRDRRLQGLTRRCRARRYFLSGPRGIISGDQTFAPLASSGLNVIHRAAALVSPSRRSSRWQ